MRRILLGFLLALTLPATAQAAVRVSAFYYPWYSTAAADGAYVPWSQLGPAPPNDIASAYYPARGLYSSTDRVVVAQQMDDIKNAGIDEIAAALELDAVRVHVSLRQKARGGITITASV
jgi:hypothetical protein